MEKDTDSNLQKFKLDVNGVLPYQEEVIALRQDVSSLNQPDKETVAYARLGEETLELLAAIGEAQYLSIVPNAIEYKLVDYDEREPLDDPLKRLDASTGGTRFLSVLEGLSQKGLAIYPKLNEDEQAQLVCALDDLEEDKMVSGEFPEVVEKLISYAVDQGLDRKEVETVFRDSSNKRGILVGLSEEFLQDAGDDVWPDDNRGENNHPSRYAELKKGLRIEYITKIIPLDESSEVIMDGLKAHIEHYREELQSRETTKRLSKVVQVQVEGLGVDA